MKKRNKKKEKYTRVFLGYILRDDVSHEILYFTHEIEANTELYTRIAYYDALVLKGKLNGYYRCFLTKDYAVTPV